MLKNVALTVFKYDQALSLYEPQGKTSLLTATTVLHVNVTSFTKELVDGNVCVDTENMETLVSYIPLTDDTDIHGRLKLFTCQPNNTENNTENDDEYIVEQIVEKKFNSRSGQFEFLVKWKDYSCRYNTWELASNIPSSKLDEFERNFCKPQELQNPLDQD